MIGNRQTFLKKKQKDDSYVCPHTLVYDLDLTEKSGSYDYYFMLRNNSAASGAMIDFGDGVVSSNLRSKPSNDSQGATIFKHTYSNPSGVYRIKFDINDISKFKRPYEGSDYVMFGISAPNLQSDLYKIHTNGDFMLTGQIGRSANVFPNDPDILSPWNGEYNGNNEYMGDPIITIVDFNETEVCSALYNWPIFADFYGVKMSNRQFQKLNDNPILRHTGFFHSVNAPIHHLEIGEDGSTLMRI